MSSYQLEWLIEPKVIKLEMIGKVDLQMLHVISDELSSMIETSDNHRVHLIVDERQVTSVPRLSEMKRLKDIFQLPQLEWAILVGDVNPMVKFIATVGSHALGLQTKRVSTIDEALQILKRVDVTIGDPQQQS